MKSNMMRREQAENRLKIRAGMTTQQKLDSLDGRPGDSKKERRRLTGLLKLEAKKAGK